MLKQVNLTLDTSDPLQAQWLAEYHASPDQMRFGRACLLLGFLAATGRATVVPGRPAAAIPATGMPATGVPSTGADAAREAVPTRRSGIGAGLFGLD